MTRLMIGNLRLPSKKRLGKTMRLDPYMAAEQTGVGSNVAEPCRAGRGLVTAKRIESAHRAVVLGSAVLCLAIQIVALPFGLGRALIGTYRVDFAYMFDGARLIWAGRGAEIFRLTISNHLPFETLLLSPLAVLGFRAAYLFIVAVNFRLFFLAVRRLGLRWP